MVSTHCHIIVIGAGIGGLTAALVIAAPWIQSVCL